MRILFGQDGDYIEDSLLNSRILSDSDKKFLKKENRYIYDFVGFISYKNDLLAVFPKHYFTTTQLAKLNNGECKGNTDLSLLFSVLQKYINNRTTPKAQKHIGSLPEYESDYPFHSFYRIYDYYKKYGLYFEEECALKKGAYGNVNWKETIRRSNKIISNSNLLFLPFFSKVKESKSVFVSECMLFVINFTIDRFSDFISLRPVNKRVNYSDFLRNKESVIHNLYQAKANVFKDIHRNLIADLITFFEEFENKKHGGKLHFKINYFDMLWQEMVNNYLNQCFVGISASEDKLVFDESQNNNIHFQAKKYVIDNSMNSFYIELDHYAKEGNKQYIFDSKYYRQIKDLNYKQIVYGQLIDCYLNRVSPTVTYSALLLPGNNHSTLHFELKPEFGVFSLSPHRIISQYICVKNVMKKYISFS